MGKKISRREFVKKTILAGSTIAAGGMFNAVPLFASTAPVRVGCILPYSKVYAVLGESITNGMMLYFDEVGGKAGGRKLEIIKEDDEVNPQVGIRKTKKLVENDKVDFLSGPVASNVLMAMRNYVHDSKTILLVSNAGADAVTREHKSPYIFRTSFSNWMINAPMGEWIYKKISKEVFVTAADYVAGHQMIDSFKEGFIPAGGKIVGEVYPPLGTNDFGPYLTQIAKQKPKAIYCFYAGSDAARFVKQFDEFGLKKTTKLTGAGFMLEEDVLPAEGKAAVGAISGLHWLLGLNNPQNKKFVKEYTKKFKTNPNVYAVQGYDTGRVIVEALNKTGGNTGNKQKLIEVIKNIKFASPRGPFEFDKITHNVIQNIYIREVKLIGGKPTNVEIDVAKGVRDPGVTKKS